MNEGDRVETPLERERRLVEAARRRASRTGAAHTPSTASPRIAASEALPSFPGYRVLREADRGGQGIVFQAVQESTSRRVAIKALRGGAFASGSSRARLEREVAILAQIDDEGVSPVIDFISEANEVFVVMPFIEGENLAHRLEQSAAARSAGARAEDAWELVARDRLDDHEARSAGDRGLSLALRLIEELARSVHAVHERGIIHRDLKPGNVMLRAGRRPVVLDFGLALDLSEADAARFTPTGEPVGTPAYMAPEQVRGEGAAIDRRADVYALGAMLYELLCFRRPFSGAGLAALCVEVAAGRFVPPRAHEPAVPAELEAVCLKAMALDPAQRYATSLELAAELARFRAGEPTRARPVPPWMRALRRRRKLLAAALALALVGLGVRALLPRPERGTVARAPELPGQESELAPLLRSIWSALDSGRPPDAVHAGRVRALVGDERTYELLTARPASAAELEALLERARRRFPAAPAPWRRIVPLAPRAATLDDTPDFRFAVAWASGVASDVAVYEVRIYDGERELAQLPVSQVVGEGSIVSAALGPLERLEPGKSYGWTVDLRGRAARSLERTAFATFRVVDPAIAAERAFGLPAAGSPALTSLARAASLLALDLAEAARDELKQVRRDAPLAERRQRALLAAYAAALVGDEEGAAAESALYFAADERPIVGAER